MTAEGSLPLDMGRSPEHQKPVPPAELYSARSENLVWVEWEEESALYNRGTGETHILNTFPAEILRSLLDDPADAQTLAQRLALV